MKVYHYTIADRLVKIMMDGFLKLTPREDSPNRVEGEARTVWLTINDTWDSTAFYGTPMEVLENAGMIRITMDTNNTCSVGMASAHSDRLGHWDDLVASAYRVGVDYRDWIISFEEIDVINFDNIELWKDGAWQHVPIKRRA